jgi:tetratricopeptide (TPR) repeat protein
MASRASVSAACLLGLAASLCASCGRKPTGEQPQATASPAAASTPAAPPTADARAPVASASARAPKQAPPKPLSAEDKVKRSAYLQALGKGRAATVAHHYDEAIAAFDQAVTSDQNGRAYAERGYAYLLSQRYDLALKDFEQALGTPTNAILLAQVWFNRGLTYAALGRGAEADLAFYRSNKLNGTKAAASRLAGKTVCPVTVDRSRVAALPYAGWRAWADAMAKASVGAQAIGYVPDATEALAADRFCSGCKGDGPWTVQFGAFEGAWPRVWDVHVMARGDGKLWDFGVYGDGYDGPVTGEPCGGSEEVSLLDRQGSHVTALVESFPTSRVPVKLDDDGGVHDCPEGSGWDECLRFCMSSSAAQTYFVLDLAHRARVMTVRQESYFTAAESFPRASTPSGFDVAIQPGATGIDVTGEGCGPIPYP